MTLLEIKTSLAMGHRVYWQTLLYEVTSVVSQEGINYYITCNTTQHKIGLVWADGLTLNGREEDFFLDLRVEHH